VCCGSYFYSQYDNDVDLIIFKRDGKPPASLIYEEPCKIHCFRFLILITPDPGPDGGRLHPALAAAVSNAGALGSLGLGAATVAQAEAMIVATRQLTDRPFNVNLFCHAPPRRDAPREADWAETLRPILPALAVRLRHRLGRYTRRLSATPPCWSCFSTTRRRW
jgi:nitronate monooxygenase